MSVVEINVAGRPPVSTGEHLIEWKPIASPVRLSFPGTDVGTVAEALVMAFGKFPIRLNRGDHMMLLRGMCAGAGPGREPYQQLLHALTQVGELELTETV